MTPAAFITTSWDDGHPLDFRVAEMLARHDLPGTFYVPRSADRETMSPARLRDLSATFEIGAHTLTHVNLNRATDPEAQGEIAGSKAWVEDTTSRTCVMFCPPAGKYSRRHLQPIREAGFVGVRTVELVSLDAPRPEGDLLVMPTTVQAHPHGRLCFARNFARRAARRNLRLYLLHGRSSDWVDLARSILFDVLERGGVFHLWGHSWEIEEAGQWHRLEEVFRFLGRFAGEVNALTNGGICQAIRATGRAGNPPAMDDAGHPPARRPPGYRPSLGPTVMDESASFFRQS
jgi:hypothetical protein